MPKATKTYGIKHESKPILDQASEILSNTGKNKIILHVRLIEDYLEEFEDYGLEILRNEGLSENWLEHVSKKTPEISELAFHAISMLSHLTRVQLWLNENNTRMAATETVNMMIAQRDLILTIIEPDVYRGKESLKNCARGGEAKSHTFSGKINQWHEKADQTWRNRPNLSVNSVAKIIAEKGESIETIRKHIKKSRKNI